MVTQQARCECLRMFKKKDRLVGTCRDSHGFLSLSTALITEEQRSRLGLNSTLSVVDQQQLAMESYAFEPWHHLPAPQGHGSVARPVFPVANRLIH